MEAHQALFAPHSSFLSLLFRSFRINENVPNRVAVSIPDFAPAVVSKLVEFLYMGRVNVSRSEYLDFRALANSLELELPTDDYDAFFSIKDDGPVVSRTPSFKHAKSEVKKRKMQDKKTFQCDECGEYFPLKFVLQKHKQTAHPAVAAQDYPDPTAMCETVLDTTAAPDVDLEVTVEDDDPEYLVEPAEMVVEEEEAHGYGYNPPTAKKRKQKLNPKFLDEDDRQLLSGYGSVPAGVTAMVKGAPLVTDDVDEYDAEYPAVSKAASGTPKTPKTPKNPSSSAKKAVFCSTCQIPIEKSRAREHLATKHMNDQFRQFVTPVEGTNKSKCNFCEYTAPHRIAARHVGLTHRQIEALGTPEQLEFIGK